MIGVVVVLGLVVAVAVVLLMGVAKGKRTFAEAHIAARDLVASGSSPADVGAMLLTERKMPPGQAIAVVSDVTGCTPREAIDVLRPHLNESLQKTYDDMTDERLQTSKDRLLKA